jgi:glycerol-1-phosphate dehydrogenase [NAD(P)+]
MKEFQWPESLQPGAQCSCGREHQIDTREVIIDFDAHQGLPELMSKLGLKGRALIIADENTYDVLGQEVSAVLSKAAGQEAATQVLKPADGKKLHADIEQIERLDSEAGSIDICLGAGSGTINDIAKHFAHTRSIPYISVPTAPSMNGYTSSIAALTVNRLKRTLPSTGALAVVADLNTLCAAPMEMVRAGVGDSISKPVANADWKLAQLIKGEYFCRVPFEIVTESESRLINSAKAIARRDPEAITNLTETLIYSGLSMAAAGTSSPASGGEHLISHALDMRAEIEGREPALHGLQVGVTTLVTSELYQKILGLSPDYIEQIASEVRLSSQKDEIEQIRSYWGDLSAEVEQEFLKKHTSQPRKREELTQIARHWDDIVEQTSKFLRPLSELKQVLQAAGGAVSYDELGISREQFIAATLNARYIRARYTILDLAADIGLLDQFAMNL